jgi:hypothetical protein
MSADNSRAFAAQHGVAEFLAVLEMRRREYRLALPAKLEAIEAVWRAISEDRTGIGALAQLERQAHNLAGTAGTFGLRDVSFKGRGLELLVKGYSSPGETALAGHATQITEAIASLRTCIAREIP